MSVVIARAEPDFGSGRNPALFPNPEEIPLRQISHQSQIVLPDLKRRFFPDIRYSRPRISNWFFPIKD